MNPYVLVGFMLLIIPCTAIIADDADGLDRYEVTFHIQGGGTQTVKTTTEAHPPDVDGVLFWTMAEPDTHEGIAVVDASDVWNPNRNYQRDLDLYPVMGAYIMVDDEDLAPTDWHTIGIATALGAVLGAVLAIAVAITWKRYHIALFKWINA